MLHTIYQTQILINTAQKLLYRLLISYNIIQIFLANDPLLAVPSITYLYDAHTYIAHRI